MGILIFFLCVLAAVVVHGLMERRVLRQIDKAQQYRQTASGHENDEEQL